MFCLKPGCFLNLLWKIFRNNPHYAYYIRLSDSDYNCKWMYLITHFIFLILKHLRSNTILTGGILYFPTYKNMFYIQNGSIFSLGLQYIYKATLRFTVPTFFTFLGKPWIDITIRLFSKIMLTKEKCALAVRLWCTIVLQG